MNHLKAVMYECREIGGSVNGNWADHEMVECHLDWCLVPYGKLINVLLFCR